MFASSNSLGSLFIVFICIGYINITSLQFLYLEYSTSGKFASNTHLSSALMYFLHNLFAGVICRSDSSPGQLAAALFFLVLHCILNYHIIIAHQVYKMFINLSNSYIGMLNNDRMSTSIGETCCSVMYIGGLTLNGSNWHEVGQHG